MGYITEQGLKELKNYKYVSGGSSAVDKIMNHWWEFFITLIPMVRKIQRYLLFSPSVSPLRPT